MRIRIQFAPLNFPTSFPLDNHPWAGLIYSTIGSVAPDYADFLHTEGYQPPPAPMPTPRREPATGEESSGAVSKPVLKRFRFFVFSRPLLPGAWIENGRLWCKRGLIEWQVASPIPEFIETLVTGLGAKGYITIGDAQGVSALEVAGIELIEPPRLSRQMRFTALSPITVAVEEPGPQGERRKHYVRADDQRFGGLVVANLREKYRALTGLEPEDGELEFEFDWDYINHRGGPERVSKLVSFREIQIKSYLAPFVLRGSEELIALGWESGFGTSNSQGFGMAQVAPLGRS